MDILSERTERVWTFGSESAPVRITYRVAEAHDLTVAEHVAARWGAELLRAERAMETFGWTTPARSELVARLGEGDADIAAIATDLVAVALAERCVLRLEGLSVDGAPAAPGLRTWGLLFADSEIQGAWLERVRARRHAVERAGNASGSTPSTTGGVEPTPAANAETSTCPAPGAGVAPTARSALPACASPRRTPSTP